MNLAQLEEQLHAEGFLHTYVWQDGPNAHYADHTHRNETAHIIYFRGLQVQPAPVLKVK